MALDAAIEAVAGAAYWVIRLQREEWDSRGSWLGLPWHGQGLMTEAVTAVNDFWFDVLGFSVLGAPKAAANVASKRISEKTGMVLIATLERDYVSGRLPAEIWEITAQSWRDQRKALEEKPEHLRIDERLTAHATHRGLPSGRRPGEGRVPCAQWRMRQLVRTHHSRPQASQSAPPKAG
ncbi:MAG TPA: GNAT family N-acetyltransferase [Granulicella sp.]|nr:GNAT family N-acetyltransferase [Granulicella sp.]